MREIVFTGLNTGVLNSTSSSENVEDISDLVVNVVQASGNIAGAVVTVEQSLDGVTWFTTGVTIAGAALSSVVKICTRYLRLRVTTASGVASTATCTVQGKPGERGWQVSTLATSKALSDILAALEESGKKLKAMGTLLANIGKSQGRG